VSRNALASGLQEDCKVIKTAKDVKSAKKESMVKLVVFFLPSFFGVLGALGGSKFRTLQSSCVGP